MTHQKIELQVGVKALLQNSEGKFLLLRRNAEKYPEVGPKWDIVGGRIDPGSSLFENLKREVKEETGLDLVKEPTLVAAQDILRVPGRHVVRLTYVGEIEGEVILDPDHDEFKWCTREEMSELPQEIFDRYVKELLEKKVL